MEKRNKKYILVAEDDDYLARMYEVKLQKEGYDVLVVQNGRDVVLEARKRKPDLILLDLIMPLENGFESLAELKADADLKTVTIIVFSNLEQDADIKKAKDLGADDYFVKTSISLAGMLDVVKKYLQ